MRMIVMRRFGALLVAALCALVLVAGCSESSTVWSTAVNYIRQNTPTNVPITSLKRSYWGFPKKDTLHLDLEKIDGAWTVADFW
jgi:hypothetical protein